MKYKRIAIVIDPGGYEEDFFCKYFVVQRYEDSYVADKVMVRGLVLGDPFYPLVGFWSSQLDE